MGPHGSLSGNTRNVHVEMPHVGHIKRSPNRGKIPRHFQCFRCSDGHARGLVQMASHERRDVVRIGATYPHNSWV